MKINPKQIEKAMKQMGIKSEEVQAEEVIIRTHDKEIIIKEPHISKVNFMGQDTFQITGHISEKKKERFSEEDIKFVAEKSGRSESEAKKALEETGDIAEAILKLKQTI